MLTVIYSELEGAVSKCHNLFIFTVLLLSSWKFGDKKWALAASDNRATTSWTHLSRCRCMEYPYSCTSWTHLSRYRCIEYPYSCTSWTHLSRCRCMVYPYSCTSWTHLSRCKCTEYPYSCTACFNCKSGPLRCFCFFFLPDRFSCRWIASNRSKIHSGRMNLCKQQVILNSETIMSVPCNILWFQIPGEKEGQTLPWIFRKYLAGDMPLRSRKPESQTAL
jgi:hypothetical protein